MQHRERERQKWDYRIDRCDVHGEHSEFGPFYTKDWQVIVGCLRCAFEGKVFAEQPQVVTR